MKWDSVGSVPNPTAEKLTYKCQKCINILYDNNICIWISEIITQQKANVTEINNQKERNILTNKKVSPEKHLIDRVEIFSSNSFVITPATDLFVLRCQRIR